MGEWDRLGGERKKVDVNVVVMLGVELEGDDERNLYPLCLNFLFLYVFVHALANVIT